MTAQNDVTNRSGCNSGKPPFSEAKNRGPVKLIDRGTGAAIILAAGNGVVLSTWGAHEMFQVGWTFAISFAAAVHILVSMSLWALPRSPLLRKVLLMLLWGIGSTFSIASGFSTVYQSNSQDVVAEDRDNAIASLGRVEEKIRAAQTDAAIAKGRVREEANRGTYSQGRPGYGPRARRLSQDAVNATAKAQEALAAEKEIDSALQALRQPGSSSEQIRNLYTETLARTGSFGNDVPRLHFQSDRRSLVAVVFGSYLVAVGSDTAASPVEKTRVRGSLAFASILDVVALLCSLLRMEMHREPRHGPRNGGGDGLGARIVDGILSLASMRDQLRKSWLVRQMRATRLATYLAERLRLSDQEFMAATLGEPPQHVWYMAIDTQAKLMGLKDPRKVIPSLFPEYGGPTRRSSSAKSDVDGVIFDPRVFDGKSAIVQAAVFTRVVVRRSDGTLVAGPQWDAWIQFLMEMLTGPPRGGLHRRAGAPPKLRIIRTAG